MKRAWDGWQRINFQSLKGGIFGVFRQGALESSRKVFLIDLDPDKNYIVKQAPDYLVVYKASGFDLMNKGFTISIEKNCDGNIYEVSLE